MGSISTIIEGEMETYRKGKKGKSRRESMKVCTFIVVVYGIALLISSSVHGCCEFQITTDENSQWLPDIYGDIVVWTDDRNGNYDIYGYNLLTKEEFQITADEADQKSPAIYGDRRITIPVLSKKNPDVDVFA
jgi:beta propeller repeat protein